MRLRETCKRAGLAAVVLGVGACFALTVQACGSIGGTGMEPIASQGGGSAAPQQLPPIDLNVPSDFQTATFAFGWFWGTEAQFGAVPGVLRTRVGYAGGTSTDPTYHNLSGAAETVQMDFDPSQVSYEQLVELFFQFHDATFAPVSGQYRSVIFVDGPEQESIARAVLERVQAQYEQTIRTQIVPLQRFTLAEDYHQKYALQMDSTIYREMKAMYPDIGDLVDSTAAMRLNSYLDGYGTQEQLQAEIGELGLSTKAQDHLLSVSPGSSCLLPQFPQ